MQRELGRGAFSIVREATRESEMAIMKIPVAHIRSMVRWVMKNATKGPNSITSFRSGLGAVGLGSDIEDFCS